MSQLIVCRNSHGIVMAADSQAVAFDMAGAANPLKIERLLPLTAQAAILTGGAADGAGMINSFKQFVEDEGLKDVVEIYQAALPFFATEYEKFMREKCEVVPLDPVSQLHFLIGGRSEKDLGKPFHLYLLWPKKKLPRLDGEEIGLAYTVPRIMNVENRLSALCKADTPLADMVPVIRGAMEAQAEANEEIGPPFSIGFVDGDGFQWASE